MLLVAIIATFMLVIPVPTAAAEKVPDNFRHDQLDLNAKSAIAIDAKTGQLLYGKNVNKPLPIASMTKIITAYLTLKAIDEKKISWETEVKPTKQIVKVANNREFSNVPLRMDHSYTVKQLYQATLVESANGAAMMLAKAVSGSQLIFVRQMKKQLAKWGINDAQIYTVCGLPNKSLGSDSYPGADKNAENELSAKDMAIVGQHLINDFPEVIKTTKIARMDFIDQNYKTPMVNFNWMLKGMPQYHKKLKVDGLKTGTTNAAGACFIATAKHNGARIITVVMGASHLSSTDPSRFEQTSKLLNYVYQRYKPIIFKQNEIILGTANINVRNGKERQINVGMKKNSEIWIPSGGQKLKINLTKDKIDAPISEGQTVCSFSFKSGSSKLISLDNPSGILLPAKALQTTGKVNIFIRFWRWLFGG